jgi:single-stranded DNA-binding protein
MNLVALVGRLARAPTTRFEPEGAQVTTFTLMIEEPGRGAQSWRLFIPCSSWGRAAEAVSVLSAEDLVSVSGKLSWRKRPRTCGHEHSEMVVQVREVAVLLPGAGGDRPNIPS